MRGGEERLGSVAGGGSHAAPRHGGGAGHGGDVDSQRRPGPVAECPRASRPGHPILGTLRRRLVGHCDGCCHIGPPFCPARSPVGRRHLSAAASGGRRRNVSSACSPTCSGALTS